MSDRQIIRRPLKKPVIGDMRERIEFFNRKITSPGFNSANFTETFDLIREVWALVETFSTGTKLFTGVDISLTPTHRFITRFWTDITIQTTIKYKNRNFKILDIDNSNERNDFLFVNCQLLGVDILEANK